MTRRKLSRRQFLLGSAAVLADLHVGRMVPVARARRAAERLAATDEALAPVKGAYGVLGLLSLPAASGA